jgi:hypothetical protein
MLKGALKSYMSHHLLPWIRDLTIMHEERFDVGLLNTFDLSQSQTLYNLSQVLRAKYDYIFKIKNSRVYFLNPIIKKLIYHVKKNNLYYRWWSCCTFSLMHFLRRNNRKKKIKESRSNSSS